MALVHGRFNRIARIVPELIWCFEFELSTFHVDAYTVQQVVMSRILRIYRLMGLTTVMLLHNDRILPHFALPCFTLLLLNNLLMSAAIAAVGGGHRRVMVHGCWHSLLVVLGTR